ncbi:MAG: hypothetical protein A3B89_00725 [Candidatus Buchananbacteria bacterium RIFCSPHIGHO2_02_FULL_40_13]|uniref:SCP domain-containing protein n=1 Tax=Candidatus Buchananbacteria bacterium RIFCSPLOWO2_01_FULL_39_33 TaxID=1797543 RepID=A0A1G1YJ83_9BACT|nr:MAG: hypothetical protein A2820_00785 [Candidatus Buchananbacteria bacterium RIFCSPHIGHO2_01_FULL_40_35]OGY50398.1 MAG: hypothetical protein A3B89_00725 [Candidatus Buchananbacteria bacterium RIFCSPHIGHO2_02_FULL_40_13]OGY51537.1 MAG: hypothetical protein A3A02_01880 [Candidatus Buchananbacteria bacterium RIFCSPLOWO2_01_FULL_39_33]
MIKVIKKILIASALMSITLKLILVITIFLYPNISLADNLDVNARELINLTNDYRKSLGLNELKPNARLTQAAVNKAQDLLTKQYFAHTSPANKKFSDWIKEVGYKYFYVGENLAIDFNNNQDLFQAWLNSPSHKENIIKPQYQEIGLAVLEGKYNNQTTVVVVQLFGSRVLGENESLGDIYGPISGFNNDYLKNDIWEKKILFFQNLRELNEFNNDFLVIAIGLCLIAYAPAKKKKNQINIKEPIINRYQAKIFRE